MLYTVTHHAYCGMAVPIVGERDESTREEARTTAARRIRSLRREGYPVVVLERGERWEVQEPEDSVLVPDDCGILSLVGFNPLARKYGKCRECGSSSDWQEGGRGEVWCSCQTCGDCGDPGCCGLCFADWANEED